MMINPKNVFISIILLLLLASCDVKLNYSNRSGTLDDDYIAEPLSDNSKKYEKALTTSNKIIELLKQEQIGEAYDSYFDSQIKKNISKDKFNSMVSDIELKLGKLKNFKKLQWGFYTGKERNVNLLYSTKIVEYQKEMLKFLFVFDLNGDYSKILGFHFKVRNEVSPPGQF